MTYCVGLLLEQGMVMLSDTRTSVGFDNISCFSKLDTFHRPRERMIATMSAGNLAISQAVINRIRDGLPDPETGEVETIYSVPTMSRAAGLVGEAVRRVYHTHNPVMAEQKVGFEVSIIIGGQIAGHTMRLFQVYAAGNYIEATVDTPFLQIGEHKYGKPILDRAISKCMNLFDGVKLALISMDSTLRSNLSVGLPLDLLVYRHDSIDDWKIHRITEEDAYFATIRERWAQALYEAHREIPVRDWLGSTPQLVKSPAGSASSAA